MDWKSPAPYSGEYTIGVVRMRCEDCAAGDSARVFLSDKLILGDETESSSTHAAKETRIQLIRGTRYRLRVEYRQHRGGTGVELGWRPPAKALLDEAVETVKGSDLAVAFLGLNSGLEGEEMKIEIPGFSGGDRTTLDLPGPQEELLQAVVHTGKPVIVVLVAGSAISANYAKEHAGAVLVAWYGGEEGGTAIAETLAGKNNPAGRLPVTFYRSVSQLPAFEDYAMTGRTYRYFAGDVLYPFGYGLSYSTFRYSGLQVLPDPANKSLLHIAAHVENSSARDGAEVVQLYAATQPRGEGSPIRQLCGFQRIQLGPRANQTVSFDLNLADTPRLLNALSGHGRLRISLGGGQPFGETSYVEMSY